MEYIVLENGIIKEHSCAQNLPDGAIEVPSGFPGYIGLSYRALNEDFSLKPLSQQVAEGIIEQPDGYKINDADTEFLPMEQEDIDKKYPPKTFAEEGSFNPVEIKRTFDAHGKFDYHHQEDLIEMEGEQPSPEYRAMAGKWVFDIDKGKTLRLSELSKSFDGTCTDAHCLSSVGFEINADETANRNIEGLVQVMEPGQSTLFRSYDNTFHSVTREQLEQMRKEIAINGQALYQAKWTLESQITGATDEDTLAGITVTADAITALAEQLKQKSLESE